MRLTLARSLIKQKRPANYCMPFIGTCMLKSHAQRVSMEGFRRNLSIFILKYNFVVFRALEILRLLSPVRLFFLIYCQLNLLTLFLSILMQEPITSNASFQLSLVVEMLPVRKLLSIIKHKRIERCF